MFAARRDNRAMPGCPARKPTPSATNAAARRATHAAPHELRIIGGQWRRTRLPVLDRPGLRPTPDRVRETLFNWLGQDLSGWRCVDAFAGAAPPRTSALRSRACCSAIAR